MENFSYTRDENDTKGWTKDLVLEMTPPKDPKKVVAILGSGDYGRAMARRLVRSGYTVYIGSRDPAGCKVKSLVTATGATLVQQEVALGKASVVVVAIGRDAYDFLPIPCLKGKILIDVSNNTSVKGTGPHIRSNAEYLQDLIPDATVVKGFNVVSAYALENGGLQGSKEVFVASDEDEAKGVVLHMVRDMGFMPVDWGSLKAARDIENVPLQLMPSWRRPVAVVFGLFLAHYILAFIQFQICYNVSMGGWSWGWKHLAMQNLNRVTAIVALWTLSLCYLPGLLAAYTQLFKGTKYIRFPKWLDDWLRMRKQLGLLMLGLGCVHACISVAIMTPQTVTWVYEAPETVNTVIHVASGLTSTTNTTTKDLIIYNFELNWRGELFLTLGAIAICLVVVLGITSLPSVSATLSWREFTFIQSKLGWVALLAAALHDVFLAWKWMFLYWGCNNTLPIGPQYALYLPVICFVMKLPLLFPPLDNYLQKIRRGHVRNPSREAVKTPA